MRSVSGVFADFGGESPSHAELVSLLAQWIRGSWCGPVCAVADTNAGGASRNCANAGPGTEPSLAAPLGVGRLEPSRAAACFGPAQGCRRRRMGRRLSYATRSGGPGALCPTSRSRAGVEPARPTCMNEQGDFPPATTSRHAEGHVHGPREWRASAPDASRIDTELRLRRRQRSQAALSKRPRVK